MGKRANFFNVTDMLTMLTASRPHCDLDILPQISQEFRSIDQLKNCPHDSASAGRHVVV